MRIWHQNLITNLRSKHLVATWREALGCYSIIVNGKEGYKNHPAVQEFIDCPEELHNRLQLIKKESEKRGFNFKKIPERIEFGGKIKKWQSLKKQKDILNSKNCNCNFK
ncbi:MAG: pyrimidine dimer DNA glycosylase/endonuclease V [Minisyncoccales bacterium]